MFSIKNTQEPTQTLITLNLHKNMTKANKIVKLTQPFKTHKVTCFSEQTNMVLQQIWSKGSLETRSLSQVNEEKV